MTGSVSPRRLSSRIRARRAGVLVAVLASLAFVAALQAGPHVRLELTDGRVIDAELYGFVNGRFFIRDRVSGKQEDIGEADVRSLNFGARDEFTRPELPSDPNKPLTVDDIRRLAERRMFGLLLLRAQTALDREGRPAVLVIENQLTNVLARPDLTPQERLNLELSRVLVLVVLGEHDSARQEFARLRRENRDDPTVRQFENLVGGLRKRAEDRPAPRSGERRKPFAPSAPPSTGGARNAPGE